MSSIGSTTSTLISFRGEDEVDLNDALDTLFKELQDNLNHCHCSVRLLAQCEERNETFMEAAGYDFEIQDYVDVLLSLFKELKSVSKQTLGKPPANLKEEYKQMCEKRKEDKKREKEQAKLQSIQE